MHPQSLIRSFRQAGQLAVQKVKDLSISIEGKSAEEKADMLKKCAMTSLNSKLVCCSPSSACPCGMPSVACPCHMARVIS